MRAIITIATICFATKCQARRLLSKMLIGPELLSHTLWTILTLRALIWAEMHSNMFFCFITLFL